MRGLLLVASLAGCFFKPAPPSESIDARSTDSRPIDGDGDGSGSCSFSTVERVGISTTGWIKPGLSSNGLVLFHTEMVSSATAFLYVARTSRMVSFATGVSSTITGTASGEEFVRWDDNTSELDMYLPTQHSIDKYTMGVPGMATFDKQALTGVAEPTGCNDGRNFIDLVMLTGALQFVDGSGVGTHVIYTPPSQIHLNAPTIGNDDHTVIYWDQEQLGKALFRLDLNDDLTAVVAGPSMVPVSGGNTNDIDPMLTADGTELYFSRDGELYRSVCR